MPTLIKLMYDSSVVVRDTAAWTFGRVCEIIPDAAINETYLKPLLEAFVNGLKAEPRVAANVCWAFTGLAEAAYEAADGSDDPNPETYCLSQYFEFIVQQLLETTDRADGAQVNNLQPIMHSICIIKCGSYDSFFFFRLICDLLLMKLLWKWSRTLQGTAMSLSKRLPWLFWSV